MEIKTVSNVQRQKERVVPSNAGLISSWIALSIFYPPSWEEKRKTFNLFFLRNLLFPFIWFNLGLRHSQSGVSLRFPGLGSHQIVKKIFFFNILFLFTASSFSSSWSSLIIILADEWLFLLMTVLGRGWTLKWFPTDHEWMKEKERSNRNCLNAFSWLGRGR